jgi:penicillin-binding protein 1A
MKRSAAWVFKTFFLLAVTGTIICGAGIAGVLWHYSRDLPKLITAADYRPHIVTQVIAVGGQKPTVIGEFKKERRYLVPYEKIPEVVVHAFISAEDDKFFEHPGINIMSMIRASIANFKAGHKVQGGSTITQQVAKSLLLTPEKSFSRKITEIILANRLERTLTKQQILYLYLNEIYLGERSYGVEAASRTYFRKPIMDISIPEAALLAGMPQAPGKYSPLINPKRAKERQVYVNRTQMETAIKQPLKIYHEEDINNKYAAYLVEQIRRDLIERYGDDTVYNQGLTVTTPTTPELTLASSKSVRDGLDDVDKRIGYRGPIKHLQADVIDATLKQLRLDLIEKKLGAQILLPDGQIDTLSTPKEFGFASEEQLLDVGSKYPAIVLNIDDRAKTTEVSLGSIHALIPFDQMKWARVPKDDKNPQQVRPEPRVPSNVVKVGDEVLVKVLSSAPGHVIVGLDQDPQIQGALLSIDAKTGYVLAMEGGYDFEKSEFNRSIQAQRQMGSSFKPILYSAALEKGYTPASIIVDSPIVYEDADSVKWKPANFEEKFYGDTTFRQALIKSRNVPTIKIAQAIQIPYVIDYARRLGMTAQLNPDLSLSLGSASVSLMEVTKVYSLFPRLGRRIKPIYVSKVIDRDADPAGGDGIAFAAPRGSAGKRTGPCSGSSDVSSGQRS